MEIRKTNALLAEVKREQYKLEALTKVAGESCFAASKRMDQHGEILQRMAESLAQLGEICATLKLTHDLDESLYMRAVKIHEQGENHGEILQQMADDLTLLSDEVVTIRGRMCERAETPAAAEPEPDTAEARQEQRERDSLLTGISNLLTYTPKVGGTDKEG